MPSISCELAGPYELRSRFLPPFSPAEIEKNAQLVLGPAPTTMASSRERIKREDHAVPAQVRSRRPLPDQNALWQIDRAYS